MLFNGKRRDRVCNHSAGSRQVKNANVSLVGASAPIVTSTTLIFVREPY